MTGIYEKINMLNTIVAVTQMTYNHNLNQLIIYAPDTSKNEQLFIVDGKTGGIISKIQTSDFYEDLLFDNNTNQLFGILYNPYTNLRQFGLINIGTGAFSVVYNFQTAETTEEHGTLDEKDQEYIVPVEDSNGNSHLYIINVATGQVVYRDSVESISPAGNVIEYRYDNTNNTLYALHWVAENTTPVTLLSFTATKQGAQNLLQWATTQEINSSYFAVERSGDGVNFTSIGLVSAAGNSSVAKSYSLVDAKPVNGMNYYRLKMVDKDGEFTYSQVRSINEGGSFVVSVYPNPVKNNLNLNISSDKAETVEVEVVDNEGKVVTKQEVEVAAGASTQGINVGSLSNGVYYVKLVTPDRESELKFVKER
jgi:hypothetical protein